jgi:hypothetical protein
LRQPTPPCTRPSSRSRKIGQWASAFPVC